MTARPLPPRVAPPLIAVVGCDGSGKSTVTAALRDWLAATRPTALCHLGKQSGNMGRALARVPLVGRRAEAAIRGRVQRSRVAPAGPDLATALGTYAFVLRRARRFRRMERLRRSGLAVVADRFPQVEVPGPMDGPLLAHAPATGLVGRLSRGERRRFEAMAAHRPDLVIRLNVPMGIAVARKPDHRPESLARKVADLSRLTFAGARVVEIDASEPLDWVLARARAAVTELLRERGDPVPSTALAPR